MEQDCKGFFIGETVRLTKELRSLSWTFKKGAYVKLVDCSPKGFDLQDGCANRMIDCGLVCIESVNTNK